VVAPVKKRILVVVDPAVAEATAVRAMVEADTAEIFVITPILPTRLAWLTNDDADATAGAQERLDGALAEAAGEGVAATGTTGSDDDLLTAIGDALAQFPADEITIATRPDEERHWRIEDLAVKVRERHPQPVRELVVTARPDPG
jgi:hypothetical protein